jgi:uncharacterized membrane protein (UPF0127 family)
MGFRWQHGPMHRVAIGIVLLAVACSSTTSGSPLCAPPQAAVRFGPDAQLSVDVADTDATREHGLMGVTSLPANGGMAFIWDAPTEATFWMKDTLIPLSIAFVDADDRVVTVREMTPCEADQCPTYAADAPYLTAIEANAGWFEQHAVQTGDRMHLDRVVCL